MMQELGAVKEIPSDFPHHQPTTADEAFELSERHEYCLDLVYQLMGYALKKHAQFPDMSYEKVLNGVEAGLRKKKGWGFSQEEITWSMLQVKTILDW